jgi:NAD(P)-dependent dehydrogenase (short-subunit alcohol dehydrogenase family)
MAVEYGPQQVRVNTILPALIETELAHTRVKPGEDWYEDYEKPAIAGCESRPTRQLRQAVLPLPPTHTQHTSAIVRFCAAYLLARLDLGNGWCLIQ